MNGSTVFGTLECLLGQAQKKEDEEGTPIQRQNLLIQIPKTWIKMSLGMLSEARARLANTQGKKAKHKAGEKQIRSSM
jgi:hypothetical protein